MAFILGAPDADSCRDGLLGVAARAARARDAVPHSILPPGKDILSPGKRLSRPSGSHVAFITRERDLDARCSGFILSIRCVLDP